MFSHIMVPVDLAHEAKLAKSLACAADLARHWGARVTYVGVTSSAPGKLGHTPEEYANRLQGFAAAQGSAHGIPASGHAAISHDPSIDLDDTLLTAARDIGADLVVMESHVPNITGYVWPSNGGKIAAHAGASVLVVRN